MVLVSHGRAFFTNYFDLQWMSIFGLLGVEIFFVLSGFLIGSIIIKDVIKDLSINSLKRFYLRRWFRTLPLYFLVVIYCFIIGRNFYWRYLFFVQNFKLKTLDFIPVSWSLSVEEWFYLLIPLVLLLCTRFFRKWMSPEKIFFTVCILVILISLIARILNVQVFNASFDFGIRKQIFLRLDSIMIGVILAGIKIFKNTVYEMFTRKRKILSLIAILVFVFIGIYIIYFGDSGRTLDNMFFAKTYLVTFISIVCTIYVLLMENSEFSSKKFKNTFLEKIFTFISKTSYSVYLIHTEIYFLFLKYNNHNIKFSIFLFGISLIVIFIICHLIYKYYELLIMNLRDKFN